MNEPANDSFQRQLDRLVDGELAEAEYQSLLLKIETTENGWRECALAFLESQAFSIGVRHHLADAETHRIEKDVAKNEVLRRPARMGSYWVAFSLAVALLFGTGGYFVGIRNPTPRPVHTVATQPGGSPTNRLPADLPPEPDSRVVTMKLQGDLVMRSGDQQVRVPVYHSEGVDPQWLSQQPSAISDHYIRELANAGHTVKQTRTLATFPLEDGNVVVTPIDHLEITPVNMHWQ